MTTPALDAKSIAPIALIMRGIGLLERIPFWLIAIVCRAGLARVFWSSAQSHLSSWQTTLYLFENSYHVPLLPPDFAAYLAVTVEIITPPLLILGLASRLAALLLTGMTLVIEIFIYPQAWPTHIQWAAMLLVLLWRGPGLISLDALIASKLGVKAQA
ncbi:MAG TPA: DoxX family membrane protein [Acetobacteraceae bacterium]|nr:DoxX family membrane protein [Acetobacteraceae bacterium]